MNIYPNYLKITEFVGWKEIFYCCLNFLPPHLIFNIVHPFQYNMDNEVKLSMFYDKCT